MPSVSPAGHGLDEIGRLILSWLAFSAALAVTSVLTPVVTAGLRRHGWYDIPNDRSSHHEVVPRGGGIACAAGAVVGLAVAGPEPSPLVLAVLCSVALLTLVGHLDDRFSLSCSVRLLAQAVAGGLAGAFLGLPWIAGGVLVFVVLVNSVNFMDGINGLTSVTMLGWGTASAFLAHAGGPPLLGDLGLVTAAIALGFLPWNAPHARVFLGDVGSYLFGGLVAGGVVVAVHAGVPVLVILSPLMISLFDVGFTLVRRLRRGAPLFLSHREHIYQRLAAELPLRHAHVCGYVLSLNAVLTCLWLFAPWPAAAVLTGVVLGFYASSVRVGRLVWPLRAHEGQSR